MQALHASLTQPGILSLGPGAPRCEYYPVYEMAVKVPAIGHFTEDEIAKSGVTLQAGRYDMRKGKSTYGQQFSPSPKMKTVLADDNQR